MRTNIIITTLLVTVTSTLSAQEFSREHQDIINAHNATIEDPNSHDTALAAAYVGLTEILAISDLDAVIPLCEKSLAVVDRAMEDYPDKKVLRSLLKTKALATNNIGFIKMMRGDVLLALEYYDEAMIIRKQINDRRGIAEGYNNLGGVFDHLGDTEKALEYFQLGIELAREDGDSLNLGLNLNNTGNLLQRLNQLDRAEGFSREALEIFRGIDYAYGQANALNTLGTSISQLGRIDEAIEMHEEAFQLAQKESNELVMANSYSYIGYAHNFKEEYKRALPFHKRALKIRQENEIGDGITQSMNLIGETYYKLAGQIEVGDDKKSLFLDSALLYLDSAYVLAQKQKSTYRVMLVAQDYADVYEARKELGKSFEYLKLSIELKDSVQKEKVKEKVISLEFEKQKSLKEAQHEKELLLEQNKILEQRIYTYTAVGGIGLSGVFMFLIFSRLRTTRKQKAVIEHQKAQVEEAHKEITDSIHYAKRIQAAVLPPDSDVKKHLPNAFILYKPKDIVAGDFYWLEEKNGTVFFAAADCTGHGVPGAMVSVVCVSGLNRSLREMNLVEPGEILDKTRELVVKEFEKSDEDVQDGMDIAICSLNGKTLKYAGAHNPLWLVRNGELVETKANKQPIGKYDNPQPYTTHTIELQQGDSIYIFSDGYPDQFGGEKGKKYKSAKFKRTLIELANQPVVDQRELLDRDFESWRGEHEQIDDVCVIGLKI